jgi:hypothetical protein
VLLPDQRIGSHRKEVIKVIVPKRPQLDQLAAQNRLAIEWHG